MTICTIPTQSIVKHTERSVSINTSNQPYLTRRIGNTSYKVRVCFSEEAEETLEEKMVKLIKNNLLDTSLPSQTSCSPERSPL